MKHLILLHGAIGSAAQLVPLAEMFSEEYSVHTLNFSGHGGKAFSHQPFSIGLFAGELLAYLDEQQIGMADIFGYSMGGYVALYLAKQHPERAGRIVTLASKFHWDQATAAREVKMLHAAKIEEKLPSFAQTLTERHAPQDWKQVLHYTAEMLTSLGADNALKPEDYADIANKTLLLLGDSDKMVSLEETIAVFKMLPNAAMGMLPRCPHPIEQVDLETLAFFIRRFLQ